MGAEEQFVDDILSCPANADVIDIELGLPANPEMYQQGERKTAPRIDIVNLERCEGGWRIVFWEAKLASNPELRTPPNKPHVVTQTENYRRWLEYGDHKQGVIAAYTEACTNIMKFHEVAGQAKARLGKGITEVGSGAAQIVDLDPAVRIVVQTGRNSTPGPEELLDRFNPDGECPVMLKRIDYRADAADFSLNQFGY